MAIDGHEYEAGGSIIHEKNLYMKRFTDELGEQKNDHAIDEHPVFRLKAAERSKFSIVPHDT